MTISRSATLLLVLTLLLGCTACSRPLTDIVATVSEDVGPWDVANAQAKGPELTADVCTARADVADEVTERLLLQLRGKGFERIQLTVYGGDGQQRTVHQVAWTPTAGKQLQQGSASGESPCRGAERQHEETQAH